MLNAFIESALTEHDNSDQNAKMKSSFSLRAATAIAAFALATRAATNLCAGEITVFAAASLTDSLKEIAAGYEKRSGDTVVFNFGASSTLARQIEEGAPADIFFSADEAKMDRLEKRGLILKNTRKSRLSNSLVIVVAAEGGAAIRSPQDLASDKVKRLALAEPATVPAGIYAKEYLQKQNLWSAVEAKVIPTENVRAALAAVEAGNVEAGIVYKTDAAISKKVKVACEVPARDGPPISYPTAAMKEAKQPEAAKRFLEYLDSNDAAKIFVKFGFIVRK
jgi:molybdate transport system substrate-binding protein